ncbi:MAG TPA: AgmX/PglI C-terminal domain-containing protein, partial [Polyangia bacterium]
ERAAVALAANTDARVGDGALELLTGRARLEGPDARVTGEVAEVTTLGVGAAATVELRRSPMSTKNAAALAALLTVGVADGGARVQAKGHAPIMLAKNDRTMIAPRLPPVTTRAATKSARPAAAKTPAPAPAARPTDAPPPADDEGRIDKDTIRAVVQRHVKDVQFCYEQALKDSPKLAGRIVVRMTLVTKDGVARVGDGEIQPEDGDIPSLTMQSCVLQAFSRWKFPPSVDGEDVVVSYPFVFKTGDE